MKSLRTRFVAGLGAAMLAVTGAVVFIAEPAAAADPATNPSIARQCGLDMTLVLDASGSVNTANAVGAVRTAADDFLTAFQDTGSTARVLQFGTAAQQLAARGVVDNASMAAGGTFAQAVANYYNPIPPAPASRTFRQYNGSGNPALATSWGNANTSSNQYTNWDQAMKVTAQDSGDLVIFITDGDPTAYDLDQPGDPFDGNVIGYNTNRGLANAVTMDRSVTSANAVKANGSRILTVGVGSALQNAASQERLTQMSGPNVAKTTADFNIETTDVALVSNFDDLAAAVRSLVLDLCSPSLTIRKMAQTADNASFQPASGWDMTATPTVPGGFDWILPTNATGASSTVSTSDDGFAQFQWEPTEPDAVSSASVSEALKAGYTAGRPGANNDYECDFRDSDGNVRSVEGELSTANGSATFGIPEIYAEIGTCTVYNSFNYAPAIQITKSNDPTVVRGDLDPGAAVTSAYLVTNPGNTPLSNVTVTDDKCGPVQPVPATGANAGDADGDGMLDVGEQWQFTCTRAMTSSAGESEATTVTNTATVNGTDPAGTQVSDTADADVSLYVPGISLVKLVNGAKTTTVPVTDPLTSVTYSYTATNTGNTPLTGVQLSDDQQACANPTLTSDPNGNGVLDLGESWTYSCTTAPAESVVNIATVEATPVNPVTGDPFADPNPPVTATDHAAVTLIDPRLSLTKSVDRTVVFPGTEVTYTYVAENTGDAPLAKPDGQQDWITDSHCSPVAYDSSDTNGDGVIDPSESWTFTCSQAIDTATTNTATIVAQPLDDSGEPFGDTLTEHAVAFVDVLTPAISVEKQALVPVVLDGDATPIAGPDTPTPRPARYLYDVRNTGQTPLSNVRLNDDKCADPAYVSGDTDGDGVLDIEETWQYTCSTALEREQATPPPGDESGHVRNTATATGTPYLPDDPQTTAADVTATDSAEVLVIEPSLTLTKTASAAVVRQGDEVTYTFSVANTGDVGLEPLGIVDDKCPAAEYQSGDANGNGLIDGANTGSPETWKYTCARVVAADETTGTDVNTATVSAIDPLGNIYVADDSATVRVIDPAIHLEKSVSRTLVPAGTQVDYTFEVTNTGSSVIAGDDVLADVTLGDVSDPANAACAEPTFTGGDANGNAMLEPEETWTYACSGTIEQSTTDVATVKAVGGTMYDLSLPVSDMSEQFVQAFHPGIAVVKTADPTELEEPGGDVTYTYEVTNTGDVPLAGVADAITDDTCANVAYVSGDTDEDGLLDTPDSIFEDQADETWTFTCTTHVSKDTVNTVVVTGTPSDPTGIELCDPSAGSTQVQAGRVTIDCDVTADATATVTVVPAASPSPTPTPSETPSVTPTEPAGELPVTGGSIPWFAIWIGIAAVAAGGVLVGATRLRGHTKK